MTLILSGCECDRAEWGLTDWAAEHWRRRQHTVMLNVDQRKLSSMAPFKDNRDNPKEKFASPLLSRHCCINFLSSDDLILHRHDAPLLMRLPTTFCQKQTASNISCFVSHIQIKKLWRISYASKNFSFHVAIRIFVLSKKYLLFWANIREWKAQYMVGRGAEV